ncbi:c-type cytochrome [Aestuariibius insulae]|uniref:c-type cytochrome n=1 Tax=Aestuariibius insulae TaxID=2058287 RepID=UPI00345E6C8E
MLRILTVLLLAGPAYAQDLVEGERTFFVFCSSCHGEAGRGDGPMAKILTVPVPDLSMLRINNDGTFPMTRVLRQVDGRDPELAHSGVMPAFGMLLEDIPVPHQLPSGQTIMTEKGLLDVALWLESIQE